MECKTLGMNGMQKVVVKQMLAKLSLSVFIELDTLFSTDFRRLSKPSFEFKPACLEQMETKINVLYIKIYNTSSGIGDDLNFEDKDVMLH